MDVIGKFPIYEADQVLSANHLNQSLAYLEKHDRLSRRLLHGIGVVCGLNFSVEEGTLTITKGCGITSEGYLIALEEAMVLTQVRKYIPPYPPKYNPFYAANGSPFTLWEAVPATEAEGEQLQDLSKLGLTDKVLLLYLEARDKDLKDCVGDDCDNNGTLREYTIRPLIIGVTDLVNIFNKDGNTVEDIASAVMGRYFLPELLPPRFDVTATTINSVSEINDSYASLSSSFVEELKVRLQTFETFYADVFDMPKTMAASVKSIEDKLELLRKQDLGHQYFFDYLTDLAAAYNELLELATRWVVACMPDEDDFPRHLALGEFRKIKDNQPKIFRNYFKHSPSTPQAHEQMKEVGYLYKRLHKMLAAFEIVEEKELRVIASNYSSMLSKKAIPYYFRPKNKADKSWLLSWNYDYIQRNRWNRIGHYFNSPENLLTRDLEFQNFFRIEGHLGRNYGKAMAELKDNINRYRLPFKAIALSTGSVPFDLDLLDECRIKDIDSRFDSAVDDLLCQLQEISCFIGALPIPGAQASTAGKFSYTHRTGAEAAAGAKASNDPAMALNINATHANLSKMSTLDRIGLVAGAFERKFTKGQFIASRCKLQQGTLGRFYLDYIQSEEVKGKSLLDLFLPYLNISNYPPATRQLWLGYSFAIIVLDEIEELVGILSGASVSNLNFKALQAFAEELMSFLKLYIIEINKLESEPEFETHVWLHDIKHQLVHLHALCKLKALFGLYESYRSRIKNALEELRFSNFIEKHPGIDHKAGVPKGGTFIMVYHTNEEEDEMPDLRPKEPGILNVDPKKALDDLKAFNPSVRMAVTPNYTKVKRASVTEANTWMRSNLNDYAKVTGKSIDKALLTQFEEFLGGLSLKEEERTDLEEGTVIADFYLPYVCCSGCGGIEINMTEAETPLNIRLKEDRFCIGAKDTEPFIVSPEGGEVTGPGVEEKEKGFVFNPASEEVDVGTLTFTYTLEGRTAQTTARVLPKPEADFQVFIDQTANGIYVAFENISRNATSFMWDFGNGQKSTEKDPQAQYYKLSQETVVITLTASNGVCDDVEPKTVTLISKEYEMSIGKQKTAFCNDQGPQPITIRIKGIGEENFPFDGVVKGPGVKEPSGRQNPVFTFNPSEAGVGNHKLVYVVDGVAEAEYNVTVEKQFASSFTAKVSRNSDGVNITFSRIKPTDKKSYNWRLDERNPTNVVQKTTASDWTHYYSPNEIGDRKQITVILQINDTPCLSVFEKTLNIPDEPQRNVITTFNPNDIRGSYVVDSGLATGTTSVNVRGRTTMLASNPFSNGQALLKGIADALENSAQRKKLLNGSMNAQLSKTFKEVLTGMQSSFVKNRRSLTTKQRDEMMAFYGQVVVGMINFVGVLEKDLKSTESLAKNFKLAADSTVAMSKLGMSAKVKNGIKNRLSALATLNKPVASALAADFRAEL
jgi:PKD repeat protein